MKTLSLLMVLGAVVVSLVSGCSSGPSPEQQTREQREEQDATKHRANFFNTSPPPLAEPGR